MRLMNESSPFRAAVIGGGPAGFYTAESLIKSHSTAEVDIFDRLPTPYGLVRYGVAPDHQQIKSIARMLDRKSTRLNSSHVAISYAVFCLKKNSTQATVGL